MRKRLYFTIMFVVMFVTLYACRRPFTAEDVLEPVTGNDVTTTPAENESSTLPGQSGVTQPAIPLETTTQPESPTYPAESTDAIKETETSGEKETTIVPDVKKIKPAVVKTADAGYGCVAAVTDTGRLLYTLRTSATGFDLSEAEEISVAETVRTWNNLSSVSVGDYSIIGLKKDGTLCVAGRAMDKLDKLTDVVQVVAEDSYVFVLMDDGTVQAYSYFDGKRRETASWTDIVQIDMADYTFVGLKSDKTVLAVTVAGDDLGQCNVSTWTDIEMVATGGYHTVGLRSDGTVLAAGANIYGECDVDEWTDIVYIEAGTFFTIGVKRDGTVVYTGYDAESKGRELDGWTDIAYVSLNGDIVAGVTKDNRVLLGGRSSDMSTEGWNSILKPEITVATDSNIKLTHIEQCIKSVKLSNYVKMEALSDNKIVTEDIEFEVSENVADYIMCNKSNSGFSLYVKGDAGIIYNERDNTAECIYSWIGSINKRDMCSALSTLILDITPVRLVGDESIQTMVNNCFNEMWGQICELEGIENEYRNYVLVHEDGSPSGEAYYIFYDLFEKYENQIDFPKEYIYIYSPASDVQVINNEYAYYYDTAREDIENRLSDITYDTSVKLLDYKYGYSFLDTVAASAGYAVGADRAGNVMYTNNEGEYDFLGRLSEWENIVSVAAGSLGVIGIRNDGTLCQSVEMWNDGKLCTEIEELEDWTDIVSVKVTDQCVIGLKTDGTVLCYGRFGNNKDVLKWENIVQIDAFGGTFVGLTKDKTVVAAGDGSLLQTAVGSFTDIEMAVTGGTHTVGLRSDGTVVAAGVNAFGECDVESWTDIVYIDAGSYFTVGVKRDGTVVAVGLNTDRRMEGMKEWKNIRYVVVGEGFTIGITNAGELLLGGQYGALSVSDWNKTAMPVSRAVVIDASKKLLPIEKSGEEIVILREEHFEPEGNVISTENFEIELPEYAAENVAYYVGDDVITLYLKGDAGVLHNRSDKVYECYYAMIGDFTKYNVEDAVLIMYFSASPVRVAGNKEMQDKINACYSDIVEQLCKLEKIENKYKDYRLVASDGSRTEGGCENYFDLYMKYKSQLVFPEDYVYMFMWATDVQVINPENWDIYKDVSEIIKENLVNAKY